MSESTITFKKTTYYKRFQVSRTAKNGWQPADMTISATYEEGREPTEETMRELARHCAAEAQAVCAELNSSDRFTQSSQEPKEQ